MSKVFVHSDLKSPSEMKYILVTGGVISGIGKGLLASSIASVLKSSGAKMTLIKIDPHFNISNREIDSDKFNYESYLGIKLTDHHNITSGKIFSSVIGKERKGDYLGKTVQVVPHITDEIQNWIKDVAKIPVDKSDEQPEVCIIELGGTIGDIESMPFVEALRQFQFKVKKENFCVIHVGLVLQPKSTKEDKTKPIQKSVKELRSLGLIPDFIICRSKTQIQESTKEKISNFCDVNKDFVICVPDLQSIYNIPIVLLEQKILELLNSKLKLNGLKISDQSINLWNCLANEKDSIKFNSSISNPCISNLIANRESINSSQNNLIKSNNQIKYILVTGGVISGIGKGIIASSIGAVLKASGLKTTSIKIDPYINIDAGTFSPYEHGEVFVLDDGSEVDLDLGNYERFLDIKLTSRNNITTGKILKSIANKEIRGDYSNENVQMIPHITDEIQNWVMEAAKVVVDNSNEQPEICIVELGGTVGDIESMSFVEAFRRFKSKLKKENFCMVHVSLILQQDSISENEFEDKTKAIQQSVREIRSLGLTPDFIMCRSENIIKEATKEKISDYCDLNEDHVIIVPDKSSIYEVPITLIEQNIIKLLTNKLKLSNLEIPEKSKEVWKFLASQEERCKGEVTIVLVGKYTKLEDAYASVIKSLNHAAFDCERKLNLIYIEGCDLEEKTKQLYSNKYEQAWNKLRSANGILIPGGFGKRGTDGKIEAIKWARENKVPILGICLGFQLAAIEFARNVLKLKDADSTELNEQCESPIVIDMPEHNQGKLGGTMRLGKRKSIFNTEKSKLRKLYGDLEAIEERHRHRYEINPDYVKQLNDSGMRFVAHDETGCRMEILELDDHPYFVAVQYHPEYLSKPLSPSPPFKGLLMAAIDKNNNFYCN